MKKTVVVLVVVAFFASMVLSSCGSTHTCPAYGKADTQKVEKNV